MDASTKYKKAGMEERIMPIKSLQAGWRRGTLQTLSYAEMFMTAMKIKNNFCNGCHFEMRKKMGWRRE